MFFFIIEVTGFEVKRNVSICVKMLNACMLLQSLTDIFAVHFQRSSFFIPYLTGAA
jgi:hypothetical protein